MGDEAMNSLAEVSAIILTYNEELNLPAALASVCGWTCAAFVVDSYSTDSTIEIAHGYSAQVYQHPFEHWAAQRNWALDNLPIETPWVLFLDADERATSELVREITLTLPNVTREVAGFYIQRRLVFMGRWLKHGGLWPNPILRLVQPQATRVEKIGGWEYFKVAGQTRHLQNFLWHEDLRGLTHWIDKHNRYASWEAQAILRGEVFKAASESEGALEHVRQLKLRQIAWERLPLWMRPFGIFLYRYVAQLGFLDGRSGLIYFFLHDFWYPFLLAAKLTELNHQAKTNH